MSEINNIKTSNQALLNNARDVKSRDANNSAQSSDVLENKPSDKVSLTDTATQLQSIRQVITDAPVVNQDRVEALKAAIDDGSYHVDTEALANNFVNFESDIS